MRTIRETFVVAAALAVCVALVIPLVGMGFDLVEQADAATPVGAGPRCTVEQITVSTGSFSMETSIDGDGSRVAFTSHRGLDGFNSGVNHEVWLWDETAEGNGILQVTETPTGDADSLSISDDGQTLAFSTGANLIGNQNADGNREVFTYRFAGGVLEQETFTQNGVQGGVELSGDGTSLMWHSDRNLVGDNPDFSTELYRLDVGTPGAQEEQLSKWPAGQRSMEPAQSENGATFTFTTDSNHGGLNPDLGPESIYITSTLAIPLGLSPAPGSFEHPTAVSGDGTTALIADVRDLAGPNVGGNRELFLFDSDVGGGVRQLTDETTGDSSGPSLDDTGDRVAFSSTARITEDEAPGETSEDLFVLDRRTGQATQLTEPGVTTTFAGEAAMSADGTHVAFVSDQRTPENLDGNRELFLATCNGPGQPFTDVGPTHPFFGEIGWMAAKGVSEGYQPGPTYRPGAPVTRGAMSAFMFRLAGAQGFVPPAAPSFADVGTNHPFYAEIEWMFAEQITTGYPGRQYRPADAVSRAAMSAFMFRLAGQQGITLPPTPTFTDVSFQHPFVTEIEWMAQKGISTGYQPGPTYRPGAPVTRAAMSAFMYRLADAYPNLGEE